LALTEIDPPVLTIVDPPSFQKWKVMLIKDAGIRINGLGLQTLELEVLEMRLVLPSKVLDGLCLHAGLSSRNIAESFPRD
jgi:hypothetical protein